MSDPDGLEGPLAAAALETLQPLLLTPVLHHSIRTFVLAAAECRWHGWDVDPDDLLVACLFHDSGTIPDDSTERFEVTGADRAVAFARGPIGTPRLVAPSGTPSPCTPHPGSPSDTSR